MTSDGMETATGIRASREPAPAIRDRRHIATTPTRLRIGMVAPPWFSVPPQGYGGTEAVVAALVDQLAARGHEVVLVASGSASTRASHQHTVFADPPSSLLGRSALPEVIMAADAERALAAHDLDIVHDHSLAGPLLASARRVPTVVTMHGPVAGLNGEYYRRLGDRIELVAISDAQRRQAPDLHWAGTVHNAIDVASFPFRGEKEPWVLWLGRFHPSKGAHLAIDAARSAGRRIVLAGKLREPEEHAYFEREVAPRLGPDAQYVGEADAVRKRELFSRASCLVFPIQWEEPFGMVMIEALACGTPVVALHRGSVPEIIDDGVTGFIADAPEALPALIAHADAINPADCRAAVRERFDLPVLAAGYERVYRRLIARAAASCDAVGVAAGSEPVAREELRIAESAA